MKPLWRLKHKRRKNQFYVQKSVKELTKKDANYNIIYIQCGGWGKNVVLFRMGLNLNDQQLNRNCYILRM